MNSISTMASETHQPLSPHPSKRWRVVRSHSKKRLPTRASSGLRRRPDSVFSRRGTSTPVQVVAPFAMRLPQTPTDTFSPASATPSARASSKRWKMGRSQQPEQRGCVLRAVPQAAHAPTLPSPITDASSSPVHNRAASDPLSHAQVDATMATSPNDEILSIIGQYSAPLPTPPFYPTPNVGFPGVSPVSPQKRSKKGRKSEGDADRIGFWKDGKAHWEAEVASMPPVPHPQDTFIAELDSRPVRLETPVREMPHAQKDKRPRIQVIIPNDLRNRAPHARPPFVSQAVQHSSAGEIISSRDVSPPLASGIIPVRNSAVSPLAHQILTQRQHTVPIYLDQVAEMAPSATMSKHPSFSSSSNASNSESDDAKSSSYSQSNRTSWTSVDDNLEPCLRPNPNLLNLDERTASKAYSIISPAAAGIFDDLTPAVTTSQPATPVFRTNQLNTDKPLPPSPEPQIPSIQQTVAKLRNRASSPTLSAQNSIVSRRNSRRNPRISLPARGLATDNGSVPHSDPPSPTLSEAETALEEHLSSITEQSPFEWDDVLGARRLGTQRVPSYSSTLAPPPPRKSSRRKRVASMPTQTSSNHIASQQVRPLFIRTSSSSVLRSHGMNMRGPRQRLSLTTVVPSADQNKHNQRKSSRPQQQKHLPQRTPSQRFIAPDAAEHVIVSILERVRSLDDLFALARVNRGFYRVFKRNELRVLRVVLQNESPSAWEHRETSPPYTGTDQPNPDSAHPEPEYTPTTFYRHHMRDTYIIAALKSLVLTRCQSFLRPETVMALASSHAARSARVENAFWRIWTFCKIFGSGKGREDDIVGQMDWLRGGPLVHQTGIRATIMTSDSFDASSALLNAPDHFAKGNGENGLSAEELYDMTEIWTCMGVLISGLEGRTEQAREFGVYEATDVRGGDIDGEENMLQEWVYYLTTLGLSTILELATASTSTDPSAFIRALESGWMNWSPPQLDGSRRTFLKEAVARVYEEKIATMAASTPQDDRAAMKQVMRQRIAAHKAEIRTRRRTGDCLLVRMSMERPMSEWEGVFDRLGGSDENLSQPQPHRHASASSSGIGGAPAPAPALPSVARRQSELIALPRMPELPAGTPTRPSFQELPAMQERNTDSTTANPLLQTLAQSKQYDYGSPVETHPALRSFLESDASSRRSSESSIVSRPSPTTNARHFSEEAVHPAFRNRAPTTTTTTTRSSRQQQRQPHSSSSSVSSISGGGASSFLSNTTPPTTANTTPHLSSHASSMHHCPAPPGGMPPSYSHLPPSYNQAAQAHQAPSAFPHAPAHPSYPTAYQGPTGGAHHSHHSSSSSSSASRPRPADPSSPASPTSFLPAHRKRASAQHPFQHAMLAAAATPNAAANTADKAIFRIVEMGFTAEDAKHALMKTDLGDGLRVDRAVELLLRR